MGQAAVATGLSREELRALELMEDGYTNDAEGGVVELALWAVARFRNFLAAGCNPAEFTDHIQYLVNILERELDYVRDSLQGQVDKPELAYDPDSMLRDREEDLATIKAAEALLERLKNRPLR